MGGEEGNQKTLHSDNWVIWEAGTCPSVTDPHCLGTLIAP